LPPIVGLLLMTGLSQVLALEDALGVTAGHAAAVEFVRDVIDRLEPRTSNLGAGVSDRGCTDVCGPDARVTLPV
jgi:hypothetical protein